MNDHLRELIARYGKDSDFTRVAPTKDMLAAAERLLGVTIPPQFVEYLEEYSYGGIGGITILGVGPDMSMAFLEVTLDYRKYGLPHNLLAVENVDEWLYCLDCDTGEVVSWSRFDGVLPEYACFDDFLLQEVEDVIENP